MRGNQLGRSVCNQGGEHQGNDHGVVLGHFDTITKAVIGACTTPVRNATMPTSASALAGTLEKRRATSAPSPAPIDKEGEKMPPGIPLSADKTDAMNFSGMKNHQMGPLPRMTLC